MAFVPSDAPGTLVIGLEGAANTYQDAGLTTPAVADDPMGGWKRQWTSTNDALQATAGKRPVLKSVASGTLTLLAPLFDGSDDSLDLAPAGSLEIAGDFHLYALVRPANVVTTSSCVLMQGVTAAATTGYQCSLFANGTGFRLDFAHSDGVSLESFSATSVVGTDAFHVLEWAVEGSATAFFDAGVLHGLTLKFYVDGVLKGTADLQMFMTPQVGASAYIGNRQGGAMSMHGHIASVLLYTGTAHTDFWRSRVEAYLAGATGTDLPGTASSRFGVFGPRTRRTRAAQHYRDWANRFPGVAGDSFSASDTDQLQTADSGHFWYKWSGDSTDEDGDTIEETPIAEPFRIVANRCLPSDKIDNSAWAGLPMGVADVRLRVMYTHNVSSSHGAGLAFRLDFKGKGWLFHYHADTHWYVSQIEPNVLGNGNPPTISHWQDFGTSPAPVPGTRGILEVRLLGLVFEGYWNRALVGTVTLSALGRSNTIHGIYCYGPNINAFDNISICPHER